MGTATVLLGPAVGVTDGDGLNPAFDDAPAHALIAAALDGILVEGGPTTRWTDVSPQPTVDPSWEYGEYGGFVVRIGDDEA